MLAGQSEGLITHMVDPIEKHAVVVDLEWTQNIPLWLMKNNVVTFDYFYAFCSVYP